MTPTSKLLAALLACAMATTVTAQAPSNRSFSDLELETDPAVKPGDNFFAWANGGWLKSTELPAGKDRWGARSEILQIAQKQMSDLMDAADRAPAGSLGRIVADFRAAYANQTAIDSRGLIALRPALDSISQVRDKVQLARLLGRSLGADVDPFNWGIYRSSYLMGVSVEPSIHGEKNYSVFLLQGGLGLPDREQYVGTDPSMQALRASYEQYISHILGVAGVLKPDQRAEAVMRLETALAESQATKEISANDRNSDNIWARDAFAREAPGMDWTAFLTAAGLAKADSIGVWQPPAVKGLAALVGSESLEAWKDYLRFHLLDRYADVLPHNVADAAMTMRGTMAGEPDTRPREQRALEATQLALSDAVGTLYAERYFPADQQARLETIVANVISAFKERVKAVAWMSPASKTTALAKLDHLYFGVVRPPHAQNYAGLVVDRRDPVGNLRRVADRNYRRELARMGQPIDQSDWWIPAQRVAAILNFQQNSYNFPAAFLQAPKFDPAASDAANYGSIGAIVGHESSHFVDLLGADWDLGNRMNHWWTKEDEARFDSVAAGLVSQISEYHPLPGLTVNGKLVRSESIADLGGVSAAFDAYRKSLGNRSNDQAYVRQQDRQFFIGFARSWRGKIRDTAMRGVLENDTHAPEVYRIATVRNLDSWYTAFDVQPGDSLYLEPSARVRIW